MIRASDAVKFVLIWVLAAFLTPMTFGGDWPGFRGPRGDGASPTTGIAGQDQVGLNIAWKKELGSGYSGVAVAGGLAVTGFSDKNDDVLVGLDAKDGKELWRFAMDATYNGHDGSHDGPISTPLIAEGRVYAVAPRGRFVALDAMSGDLVWSINLADEGVKIPFYGFTSSPVFLDGVVVLQTGAPDGAVSGFDSATGEKLWAVGEDTVNFESPIICDENGKTIVMAVCDKKLMGVDAANGQLLWEHPHEGGGQFGTPAMSPVLMGANRVLLTNKTDSSAAFERGDGGGWKQVWEQNTIRKTFNVPIYHDGNVYAYSARFLTCVDAATGDSKWRSRDPGDGFMSLMDGHLVIATKEGGVHIVEATPDGYHEVASVPVFDDLCWTNPSIADKSIYVRGLDGIARIDITHGASTASVTDDDGQPPDDTVLGRFLATVRGADDRDKLIDGFLEKHKEMPITEGSGWVHFVYRGEGDDLAVAGDLFGARQERPMHRLGDSDFFYYSVRTEPDARFNYLFLKDFKETTDPRNPNQTYSTLLTKDMEMSFSGAKMDMSWAAMPEWKKPRHLDASDSARKATIESGSMDSEVMGAAIAFDVYLPHGYADGEKRYPVVYVHGGMTARQHGKWETTLNNVCGDEVAELIVVFVNHFTQDSGKYADMFATELVGHIDEKYRTIASADGRATVGMGFTGLTALFCAVKHPGVAEKIGLQSPFIFEMMRGPLDEMITSPDQQPLTIYMEWGKYDLRNSYESWNMTDAIKDLAKTLEKKGYKVAGGEVHDGIGWSSWRNRTDTLLATLFPKDKSS